jgi:hypothetical protein
LKSTATVRKFSPSKIKICHRTVNPPSAYQQLPPNSSRSMGKNRQAGPKTCVYIRVANLADFSPKIANLGFLLEKVLGIF